MSKAIPTKPPHRPFRPAYAVNTTTRVPGRPGTAGGPVVIPGPDTRLDPTSATTSGPAS